MKLNYKDCFQYFLGLPMHRPKKLCALCINPWSVLCKIVHIVFSVYAWVDLKNIENNP